MDAPCAASRRCPHRARHAGWRCRTAAGCCFDQPVADDRAALALIDLARQALEPFLPNGGPIRTLLLRKTTNRGPPPGPDRNPTPDTPEPT